jgi:hypothetical protein
LPDFSLRAFPEKPQKIKFKAVSLKIKLWEALSLFQNSGTLGTGAWKNRSKARFFVNFREATPKIEFWKASLDKISKV